MVLGGLWRRPPIFDDVRFIWTHFCWLETLRKLTNSVARTRKTKEAASFLSVQFSYWTKKEDGERGSSFLPLSFSPTALCCATRVSPKQPAFSATAPESPTTSHGRPPTGRREFSPRKNIYDGLEFGENPIESIFCIINLRNLNRR
jgi:hypothetical protein